MIAASAPGQQSGGGRNTLTIMRCLSHWTDRGVLVYGQSKQGCWHLRDSPGMDRSKGARQKCHRTRPELDLDKHR